ncbi:MAG: integrase arm-type DNA-binding domain-containing protein [Methylocella sp.]
MAKPLTIKALENLKPAGRRREVSDGGMPGLYFVIQPSGKQSWAYRYRFNGRPRKWTIGPNPAIDLKTARELAREALRKVAAGADPCTDKKAAKAAARIPAGLDLIETVASRFVAQHAKRKLKPATAAEIDRLLGREIVGPWRGRRLSQITRADIHDLLDGIVARGSPVTANRTLAWLRRMCAWAIERGLVEVSPCAGIRAPAPETSRDRVLSDDELKVVWSAADALESPYNGFIKLLILTGARRSEVAGMMWREIDFDAKLWTLPAARAKNSTKYQIPLSDAAVKILRAMPRIAGSDLVFTLSGRVPIRGFHNVKTRIDALMPAGPSWTLHDLRRTFASGCARLGIAVHVVEAALNHRSGSIRGIAAIYNRYSYDVEKRAAMQAWARHVQAVVGGEAQANVVELARARG